MGGCYRHPIYYPYKMRVNKITRRSESLNGLYIKSQGFPGESYAILLLTRACHGDARPETFFRTTPLIVSSLLINIRELGLYRKNGSTEFLTHHQKRSSP